MSTPLMEQLRRLYPHLRYTVDRYDYKKSPVRFSLLYRTFEHHAIREGGCRVTFSACPIPAHCMVAVSEYPLALAFGVALRVALYAGGDATVHISTEHTDEGVSLTLAMYASDRSALTCAIEKHRALLTEIAVPSHFEAKFSDDSDNLFYTMVIPYYNEANFEVYANEFVLANIASALEDAKVIYP